MSGPGKGRYTVYVPDQTRKSNRLRKIFNKNPMSENMRKSYGVDLSEISDNTNAARLVANFYKSTILTDYELKNIEKVEKNSNVFFVYFSSSPDTSIFNQSTKGPPANSYFPDLISPGANEGSGFISDGPNVNFLRNFFINTDFIDPQKFKKNYLIAPSTIEDKDALCTVSPAVSSKFIGASSIDANLSMGSSTKKLD